MALVLADRVRENTTTTGTGTVTLTGAVSGYQSFSAVGDGNTTYYAIVGGTDWEVGLGTYTASGTTLSRDTVLGSSNSGSLVDFAAGTKDVFVTYPAGKAVTLDGTETLTNKTINGSNNTLSNVDLTSAVTGTLPIANGGTNSTATPTSGGVSYGTGTAFAFSSAGTSGQVLISNGTSAPTFGDIDGGTF